MKIALDATYSLGRQLTGVGVYSQRLLAGLCAAHPESRFHFAYRPHRFLRAWLQPHPPNASRMLLTAASPARADLFHSLNQRLDARSYRKAVATFHDLFAISGDYSTVGFRARFAAQARQAAQRADLLIAVSKFTASQLVDLLGVERSRIRVVPHGVDLPAESLPDAARENLVLFVGSLQRRKNTARLVEAFAAAPPGWKLVLAGSRGFGFEDTLLAVERSPRAGDIEIAGYVSPAHLEQLYARARIFAFPSLDEGFGMPVLDAMARGIPVITSRGGAMQEVAGDAAELVDAGAVESIGAGLAELARNEDLRNQLRRRGRERAAAFPWRQAAQLTWDAYRELLG